MSTTITALPAAAALAGSEVLPADQGAGTVKVTSQAVADLAKRPTWWTSYAAGSYYSPGAAGANLATASWGAGQIMFVPFRPVADVTVDRLRIYTNQVVGGEIRMGIYNADAAGGAPGTVLIDAGTAATTGAAGDRDIVLSQALAGGRVYWLAVNCNLTTTISVFPPACLAAWQCSSPGAGGHLTSLYALSAYGALPNNPTTIGLANAAGIVVRAA